MFTSMPPATRGQICEGTPIPTTLRGFSLCAISASFAASFLLAAISLLPACSGRSDTTGTTQRPPHSRRATPDPLSGLVGQVGNQVRGIDAIPDYDAEAQALRQRVEPRLPSPLPSRAAACTTMLDAARQFYVDTEGEGSWAVESMDQTHDGDLADCKAQTSAEAAACVAVLMSQNEGEFPWVLDQCGRAFPKDGAKG